MFEGTTDDGRATSFREKLGVIQKHKAYLIVYWILYTYMMLNDTIKLTFFPKMADIFFNGLTLFVGVIWVLDITVRSITESGYVLRFFFWTDVSALIFITFSALTQDISRWITVSFLKMVMVVRITNIVTAYKELRRSMKLKNQKREKEKKKNNRRTIMDKNRSGSTASIISKKKKSVIPAMFNFGAKKSSDALSDIASSRKRSTKFNNVNIQLLNNLAD